ncbi:asialoglycoprotein receptor 1-like [Sphaeramia orbicularis]|uniref:asialoglycoprotein receptor 1-like n=1 Tax=Sphaeramia orbicularis TaxID=375764 RepID=UPI00117CE420|nr:asialoglycoprotein receptor 1-like [Sphaeramia orbicularis]
MDSPTPGTMTSNKQDPDLYADVSDTKPEWESLISDYQNISERFVTVNTNHNDLKKDNELLKEHNIWLEEETRLLNKSLVKLMAINCAMSVESTKLQEKLVNLTQQCDQLVQSSTEQEEEKLNMTQTIKLLELNEGLREELRGAEELQRQNQNLSRTLAKERQDAAEREQNRRLEVEQMEAEMNSVKEALDSLDLYCPVVNLTTKERMCKKCHKDWRQFQTKCYYFSSRMLTWSSSRAWCQTKGGDLLIINSKEEQSFIFASSQTVDQADTRLWIGMTDTEKEGEWKWVDGSQVTSGVQYWLSRSGMGTEPMTGKQKTHWERTVDIDTTVTALESWMDGSCKIPYRWICEMNV